MSDMENQMGLFEAGATASPVPVPATTPATQAAPYPRPAQKRAESTAPPSPAAPRERTRKKAQDKNSRSAAKKRVSGLVPTGDIRLTANIREDLHLKIKLASVYRRTTIGEIIEELIEKYV